MSKYECPECCGEGFELDVQIDSAYPAMFVCQICMGLGWIEEILVCQVCKTCIEGHSIDPDDPDYEDIIEFEYCSEHKPKKAHFILDEIASVQPMTGSSGIINYTSTSSSGTVFNSNGTWQFT